MTEPSRRGKEPVTTEPITESPIVADQLRDVLLDVDGDTKLKDRIANIRAYYDESYRRPVTHGEPAGVQLENEDLKALLLTEANGDYELPTQTVMVEYLRADQKLLIPAPLAYSFYVNKESESRVVTDLYERYLKVAGMTYADVKALVTSARTPTEICERVDNSPRVTELNIADVWMRRPDLGLPAGSREAKPHINMIFASLSRALQYNCDIRDVGMLLELDMRVGDSDWLKILNTGKDRLRSKLKPLTVQTLAALNYIAVGRLSISAWTRALAVSSGILPVLASRSQVEYAYTYDQPPRESVREVLAYQGNISFNMQAVCLNIVAMYGLLHLAKDHTYKSNDMNMERICTSWIMTLRTIVGTETIDLLKANLESVCRTAVHPFGLGQTYWVARLMYMHNLLASPLAIRADITPPTVQRVMIVKAAAEEWSSLVSGQMLNRLFSDYVTNVNIEYANIISCPPSFSNLWRLYGLPEQRTITEDAYAACTGMMPIVYGYSMAMHVDEDKKRDGLALALSFANVARDNKVLAKTLETIWGRYLDDVSKTGLLDFVAQSAKALGIEMPKKT